MISTRTGINDGSATLGPDTMVFSAEREKSSKFGTIFTGPPKSQIALIEVILKCHILILLLQEIEKPVACNDVMLKKKNIEIGQQIKVNSTSQLCISCEQ